MADKKRGPTVEIDSILYDEISTVIENATGIRPVLKDFVDKAIREKLAAYRTMADESAGRSPMKKAAGQ